MTKDELISLAQLARKVDEMAREMVTKDLLKAEVGRIDEALAAHVLYTRSAAEAEAKRLDSIREVDATAVRLANDRAVEQAGILAKQMESVATTLRELVSTTASAAAENLAQQFAPITTRLGTVEAKQYENQGRAAVADPMITALVAKMEKVATTLALGQGKGIGANALWGYIVGGIGLLAIVLKMLNIY